MFFIFSKILSFTITSVGFSNKIIYRNKAKINDDIYITGNLGDSFIGLKVLQKKLKLNKNLMNYFVTRYFHPVLYKNITEKLLLIANKNISLDRFVLIFNFIHYRCRIMKPIL